MVWENRSKTKFSKNTSLASINMPQMAKMISIIFSIENANISQLFFYSINLLVDKVYNAKNIFCIAILYRKIGLKNTFDLWRPIKGALFREILSFKVESPLEPPGKDFTPCVYA